MARRPEPPCPELDRHTPCPDDYRGWHVWAEGMAATHDQQRCGGCGKWSIWVERAGAAVVPAG